MIDLQTVFFRDVAPVNAIDFVTMARVRSVNTAALVQVEVDGLPARFMVVAAQEIAVALPNENGLTGIGSIRLIFSDGASTSTEIISSFDPKFTEGGAPDAGRVIEDATILRLEGESFQDAIDVRVNNQSQKFTVISNTEVLATLPKNLSFEGEVVDFPVDVVVSSKTIRRTSFFTYQLTDQLKVATGTFKATMQFIKVLMTTPGSDAFDPGGPAGNLQNVIGIQIAANSGQTLLAKLVLSISTTAAKFISRQQNAGVPPEERISSVEVVNVGIENATSVSISLRIRTFEKQQAIFSLLLNTVEQLATGTSNISG